MRTNPTKVVHCKKDAYDVYIGRPSKWGNPFAIGKDGSREQVIEKYRQWILTQPHLLRDLHELRGKVLACWCAPLACHGDVLVEMANKQLIICGTGHRPDKLGGYGDDIHQKLVRVAKYGIGKLNPTTIISGMALGWDMALAQAAIDLQIPFWAYCPCKNQDSVWNDESKRRYHALLNQAAIVRYASDKYTSSCMHDRNMMMVDNANEVLALWNGVEQGGTWNCIKYALSKDKPVWNVWDRLQEPSF